MIKLTLKMGGDLQEVVIKGNELMFFDIGSGMMTTLHGLRLSKANCIKEFPDLKDDGEWKKKSIERLKKKMNQYKTEMEKAKYVNSELVKQGYESMFYQRAGFRPSKWRD